MKYKNNEPNCERLDNVAAASCRKLKRGLARLKEAIQSQYSNAFPGRLDSIERALAEAEASAWSTPFPSLFFPPLARIRLDELGATATTNPVFFERS